MPDMGFTEPNASNADLLRNEESHINLATNEDNTNND